MYGRGEDRANDCGRGFGILALVNINTAPRAFQHRQRARSLRVLMEFLVKTLGHRHHTPLGPISKVKTMAIRTVHTTRSRAYFRNDIAITQSIDPRDDGAGQKRA